MSIELKLKGVASPQHSHNDGFTVLIYHVTIDHVYYTRYEYYEGYKCSSLTFYALIVSVNP